MVLCIEHHISCFGPVSSHGFHDLRPLLTTGFPIELRKDCPQGNRHHLAPLWMCVKTLGTPSLHGTHWNYKLDPASPSAHPCGPSGGGTSKDFQDGRPQSLIGVARHHMDALEPSAAQRAQDILIASFPHPEGDPAPAVRGRCQKGLADDAVTRADL
jgi:hypothetical protein